ncbi:MAG: trimethylamine methyltransferase family protein [Bryobacteraceae bacterium]|nr:trimethylamine methyltransferase family protein [Bryobacteraceae bacterium]
MILSDNDCRRIHDAALEILDTVGVRVDSPEIVNLLRDAGAAVVEDSVVRLPAELVEWAVRQAPRQARIADRRGNLWELSPGGPTLVLTGNALYITRGRERADLNSSDLAELARIVDACPNIHGMVGTSIADVPPACRDFVGFRIMARHTAKHLRPCIYTPRGGRLVMEMAQALLDGASLRERPVVSTGFSILSPLHWTSLALGVFQQTAGFGAPVMINSEPLGGATAPVTLAGCLAVGDADALSGLVINQLLEPGRPCIYNLGFAHVIDMASAIALTGAPENALLQAAGADLARYHGLPCAAWMSTEAMTADAQATLEKTMTGAAHAAAGVNLIWGAGNLESTLAMSPEALVADDEVAGYFLRFREGVPVNEETLALDAIREIGLSGRDFLTSEHTLANYRRALSRPRLASRVRRSTWEARGARTLEEAAQERVREVLAAEPRLYLDARQEAELERLERIGLDGAAV